MGGGVRVVGGGGCARVESDRMRDGWHVWRGEGGYESIKV